MPLRVRLELRLPQPPDARLAVAAAAEGAIEELRRSLVGGYEPSSGERRRLNSDGKPEGYRTGKLAGGLRRTAIVGDQARASTTIVPPADRRGWVESRDDVLVADGTVAEALERALDDYLQTLV